MEEVVDDIRPLAVAVNAVEDVACRLHRQCGDSRTLAVAGDCCNARSNTVGYGIEPAQFIHQSIDLPAIRSSRVENKLCVVEDHENLPGGQERS